MQVVYEKHEEMAIDVFIIITHRDIVHGCVYTCVDMLQR